MLTGKTIVKLLCTWGLLILYVSLATAQTYTSVPVKYKDGWWLEFKDDSRLDFKNNQGKLTLQWKGKKHSWLSKKTLVVRSDNFAALETTHFDRYSKEKYAPILKSWQKRKAKHDKNEKKRYEKDKLEYKDAKDKYDEDLLGWKKEKELFDKKAEENFRDELAKYKKERKKKPIQATYEEDKPEKPPVPAEPIPFNEIEMEPKINRDPAYQVTGLAVELASRGCPSGNFRLETSPGKIHFVRSSAKNFRGASPWSESTDLTRCSVLTKTGRALMNVSIDQKRLVALSLDSPKADLRLKRVSSPVLRKFEKEFAKRDMYLKKLDFRKERVEASYWNAAARTAMDVVYETKKKTRKVSTTLPVNLYDPQEKNLDRLVTRVNLFQVSKLGDKKVLQLRRLYKHKPKGNPKKWMALAGITHVVVQGKIHNTIKLKTRTGTSVDPLKITSGGFVSDFSALSYLAAWHTKQKTQSLPLTYFDDSRAFVMELNRLEQTNHNFQGRQLSTQVWEVKNSDGDSFMLLSVGLKDQIVYRIEMPARKLRLDLRSIGTQRIRENQAWAEQSQKKNKLVPVSGF